MTLGSSGSGSDCFLRRRLKERLKDGRHRVQRLEVFLRHP